MRWWQQSEEHVAPVYQSSFAEPVRVTEPVAAPPQAAAILDIGEELEAEARRVAQSEAIGERVTIYPNQALIIAKLKRRMIRVGSVIVPVGFALAVFLSVMLGSAGFLAIGAIYPIEIALLYLLMHRIYTRQRDPVVRLTDEGIELHTFGYDVGLIRWDEIADIRPHKAIYRFVGISLRDSNNFCATRPRKATTLIRMNSTEIQFKRGSGAPPKLHIKISDEHLPMSSDALIARINTFRATRGV
jgi:hypothetical protein